tara:strand:+ start:285 stop:677 length:393 start_codon:yes stop_codon:yes gene_type:complete
MSEMDIHQLTQIIGLRGYKNEGEGVDWLKEVRDAAYDLRAEFAREGYGTDQEWDTVHEAAEREVPIWTNQLWVIWTDLSGYAFDESHYRDDPTLWADDINNIPRLDLYQMAHRIFAEIVMKGYIPLPDTR